MNALKLFTTNSPNFKYSVSLEGKNFTLSLLWLERTSSWYLSLTDYLGETFITNYKIVPSYPMLANYDLQAYSLTGYFVLLPKSENIYGYLQDNYGALTQYYDLYYVYPEKE